MRHDVAATGTIATLIVVSVGLLSASDVRPATGDPLRVSLMRCRPVITGAGYGPRHQNKGFGNLPADRRMAIQFAYHHDDASDVPAAASKIQRIELCWVDSSGQGHCPGTGPWLHFEKPAAGGSGGNGGAGGAGGAPLPTNQVTVCTAIATEFPGGQSLPAEVGRCPISDSRTQTVSLPVIEASWDWGDPATANTGIILRVTTAPETAHPTVLSVAETLAQANQHGICPNYSVQAAAPADEPRNLHVVSTTRTFSPFPVDENAAIQLATCQGSRMVSSGDLDDLLCVSDAQAEYMRTVMRLTTVNQDTRLQVSPPLLPAPSDGSPSGPNQVHQAWRNGLPPGGGIPSLPAHVFLFGNFVDTAGAAFVSRGMTLNIDPVNDTPDTLTVTQPPGVTRAGDGNAPFSVTANPAHELMHTLQATWVEHADTGSPEGEAAKRRLDALVFGPRYFTESQANSVEYGSCLFSFPNATNPTDCVSWAKMEKTRRNVAGAVTYRPSWGGSFYQGGDILLSNPTISTLLIPYTSAWFWHYIYSQFAYPLTPPSTAHPAVNPSTGLPTTLSAVLREPNAETLAPSARHDSDQGFDFTGLLFQQIANTPDLRNIFGATDDALRRHLGRTFRDVVFDFHTAMFLKEYADTDPRWRFDWANEDGFTASANVAKPIAVPPDLYGITTDGYVRARRTMDLGQDIRSTCPGAGGCTPAPLPLQLNQSQGVTQDVFLAPYGTTALSVTPTVDWVGRTMAVNVNGLLSVTGPRIRIFQINGTARVPTPMCGQPPLNECIRTTVLQPVPPGAFPNPQLGVQQVIPINADVKEVLLVASNSLGDSPSRFTASFRPAGLNPGVVLKPPRLFTCDPARPSVFQVSILQRALTNVAVTFPPSALTLSIPNCAKAGQGPTACNVPPTDVQVLPPAGGLTTLLARLPSGFCPTLPVGGTGALSLRVALAAQAAASSTVEIANRPPTQATVLVMDRTGEIGPDNLAAMKTAAKALVQSLLPIGTPAAKDKIALVAYAENADTLTSPPIVDVTASSISGLSAAIDGIVPGEFESIGDGVFEAQSILANAFDDATAANRPDRQVMIVLNGALHVQDASPDVYVNGSASPPTGDGNGSWGSRPLTWPARRAAGLPLLDHLQTIGFGPFADLGRLERLSRLTNSGTVPLTIGSEESLDLDQLTRRFADIVTAAYTTSSRYSRILAGNFEHDAIGSGTGLTLPEMAAGTKELRVVVVGDGVGLEALRLVGPSGPVLPIALSEKSAALKVGNPVGSWRLVLGPSDSIPGRLLFVEASVDSPIELVTQVDVADLPLASNGQAQSSPLAGSPMYLRAIPRDGQPVVGCTVMATVTDPDGGSGSPLRLIDDGLHNDGEAGDGVYGTTYGGTAVAGAYGVAISADCVSPTSATPFRREKSTGLTLAPVPVGQDTDLDGMPNVWETAYGLNANSASDAMLDADGDDVLNVHEFRAGTSPTESDTDGGGESDLSELVAGRNPLAQDDDRVSRPVVLPEAGNAKVAMSLGMGPGSGGIIVERAPTETGPWTRLSGVHQPGNTFAVDATSANGAQACYRVRVNAAPITSGWSAPRCVTPAVDPYPPTIALSGAPPCGHGSPLTLRFEIADPVLPTDAPSGIPLNLGVSASGVKDIRYWFGDGDPPAATAWLPVTNPLIVPPAAATATMLSVQVRDAAGNVSQPARIRIPAASCIVASAGPDQLLQCSGLGATAQFDGSASRDTGGGALFFMWSAPGIAFNNSGLATPTARVPLGTTTATVVVSGTTGGSQSDTVQVTVVDTLPPVLTIPVDVTVTTCTQTNLGNATAIDGCGGAVTITNNKPTKFPLGTTNVTWYAIDAFGNVATAVQKVTAVLGDSSSCCPSGTNIVMGTSTNNVLNGTSGSDCILGLGGQDTINGSGGNDYISGGEGNDVIDGGVGNDQLFGGNGQDQLRGTAGNDLVNGGGGDDLCYGGDNDDVLRGGDGQDQLFGENGNDQIFGDNGDDTLEGGGGDDALDGGGLHDTCLGGAGVDTFTLCETSQQ